MIYEACFKVIIPELVLRTGAKGVSECGIREAN